MTRLDETRSGEETSPGSTPDDHATGGRTEKRVNEIVESAKQAKDGEKEADRAELRNTWIAAGVGVGIGSAALVAAMLYANRDKGKGKPKG